MSNLLPLFISANRKSWAMLDDHAGESDRRYSTIRKQVLERDNYTCQYCGFRSSKYQEINHKNDDHGHNDLDNLATACPFCHLCPHLGLAGYKNAGTVIWCPEHSQASLNNLCRAIFIAVLNGETQQADARSLYAVLMTRANFTEEFVGKGGSKPAAFGQALLHLTAEAKKSRDERLHGFRLLPHLEPFSKQLAFWQTDEAGYAAHPDSSWTTLATGT